MRDAASQEPTVTSVESPDRAATRSSSAVHSPAGTPPATGEAPRGGPVVLRSLLGILVQLGLLLVVIHRFEIESAAFIRLATLAVGGFVAHYFLPLRHRLPFFVLLSLGGIVLVMGPTQGAWLIGLGLAILGIAHLPLGYWWRIGLLGAIALALVYPRWRGGWVPWSAALWPVLGSMFVFRLMVYMYDRKHGAGPSRASETLAYFFMLPNVCFPLFPVVDFKQFCRGYYNRDRHDIYQVGVGWIWRGLLHLLVYRLVYNYLTVDSVAVDSPGELAAYAMSTFLLYVRISGQFHLIVGLLHLFGFNLPETNHRYLLASSFTDFWRRINIYWKDFMMKLFYYPTYFRFRKLGDSRAIVIATTVTFAVTWFLHLAQWFWIRGSVLVAWNDILFWTILGLLVVVNSLMEATRGRARRLQGRQRTPRESVGLALRTVGTFATICALWSFWTAESASDWVLMVQMSLGAGRWDTASLVGVFGALAGGVALVTVAIWRGWILGPQPRPSAPAAVVLVTSLMLCLLTLPGAATQLGAGADVVASLRSTALNRRDAEEFQRGYYENLLDVRSFNDELRRVYDQLPADFVRSLRRLGLARPTGDEQDYELVPLKEGRFVGAMVRTNRWGMRDGDYPQRHPPGTYRFALLGPSTTMGSGVEAADTFESLLERQLAADGTFGRPTELLNFGVAGYTPLHVLYQLRRKVFTFEPDVVMYVAHSTDVESASRRWVRMVQAGIEPSDQYLRDLVRRTGVRRDMGPNELRRRIRPYEVELLAWIYGRVVTESLDHGARPVFVYMEVVTDILQQWRQEDRRQVQDLAHRAGFLVLDLTGVYGDRSPSELWIAPNDPHPNILGNQLIAHRLMSLLKEHRQALRLSSSPGRVRPEALTSGQ